MGRTYAGILGPLAFCVVITRSLLGGGGFESTIWLASLSLFAFAALGYVVGTLASNTVRQSVQFQMNAELAALRGSMEKETTSAPAA